MNKILLKKLIREEIKNLKEQSKDIMTDFGMLSVPDQSAAKKQAIQKMADALGVNVNINLGQAYNKIEFIQKRDVEEKTFEQMIQFLEKLGYNVDLGKSVRDYDSDPGERHYYPQIRF
jgi:hypothetical protein